MHREISINYEYFEDYNELSKDEVDLIQKAYGICEKAYAPYSEFKVGASILLSNGEVILGNNQENAAYPSGLCAERVALFYANANYDNDKVQTIVVVSNGDLIDEKLVITPCGSCRQVMLESEKRQDEPIRIILVARNRSVYIFNSIQDLLPFGFGSNF